MRLSLRPSFIAKRPPISDSDQNMNSLTSWREQWIGQKCNLASGLSRGESGGGYAEAMLIICASISALSAEVWPGRKIDHVRFVELLTTFGPEADTFRTISVPLLLQENEANLPANTMSALRQQLGISEKSLVVSGSIVDRAEVEILKCIPSLKLRDIRRCSYASILYSDIRSSYAHEYQPGDRADSWPMTMLGAQKVSYVNQIYESFKSRRLAHFHVDWLVQVPVAIAKSIDEMSPQPPMSHPGKWWLDGRT